MKIEILKEENKYLSHTMRELIRPSSFQQFNHLINQYKEKDKREKRHFEANGVKDIKNKNKSFGPTDISSCYLKLCDYQTH